MGNDKTVSGTFLRASDGQFVSQDFKVRGDYVSLHAGTLTVNEYMKRADYDGALKSFSRLTDPLARKSYVELASWYTYDSKGYEKRVTGLSEETLGKFAQAGVKLDHTHLYAVDDHINRNGRAVKDRVLDIGDLKLSESLCNFVNLSKHLGGFNAFEAERMHGVFKGASRVPDGGPEAERLIARRLQNASSLGDDAAMTAAKSYLASSRLVI